MGGKGGASCTMYGIITLRVTLWHTVAEDGEKNCVQRNTWIEHTSPCTEAVAVPPP